MLRGDAKEEEEELRGQGVKEEKGMVLLLQQVGKVWTQVLWLEFWVEMETELVDCKDLRLMI